MADAVTSQTVMDNKFNAIMKFTNVSDGTGESAVVKVTCSALAGAPTRVAIEKVQWMAAGLDVTILEDAGTDVTLLVVGSRTAASSSGTIDFSPSALQITEAVGATGDIAFTTTGHVAGDTYTIVLHLRKIYLNK